MRTKIEILKKYTGKGGRVKDIKDKVIDVTSSILAAPYLTDLKKQEDIAFLKYAGLIGKRMHKMGVPNKGWFAATETIEKWKNLNKR